MQKETKMKKIQATWTGACSVQRVVLDDIHSEGVYLIWKKKGAVVLVGQGKIADKLSQHKQDPAITCHGDLYAMWAEIGKSDRDGVEKYLASIYAPLVGDRLPNVTPIAVNLPS
jgi:hypothetical protein